MKKIFTLAAVALTLMVLTVACNSCNGSKDNEPLIDTNELNDMFSQLDSITDDMLAEDMEAEEVDAEEEVNEPAPAKTKKAETKKAEEPTTAKKVTLNDSKKKAAEVAKDLQESDDNTVEAKKLPGKKAKAADAFKKNKNN